MDEPIAESFSLMVDIAVALGMKDINELPGCWEHEVSPLWWFAINGHRETMECSKGTRVPAFTAYVMFNGWPAGFIAPSGGCMAAGAAANEDTLILALKANLAEIQTKVS